MSSLPRTSSALPRIADHREEKQEAHLAHHTHSGADERFATLCALTAPTNGFETLLGCWTGVRLLPPPGAPRGSFRQPSQW